MNKVRRFLHVVAIGISSVLSLIAHGTAKAEPVKKKAAPSAHEKQRSSAEKSQAGEGGETPPLRLDPKLMETAIQDIPMSVLFEAQKPESSRAGLPVGKYPWRERIVTTTFWVGEVATRNNPVPNHKSSWDTQWARNYGGFDNPDQRARRRGEFIPVAFVPKQNPFYVALPYNDVTRGRHKPEASRVIPWFNEAFEREGRSVCKGRWIAIHYKNRIAYAQWEDCGPFRTDHWQYVFGTERPKPNLNRGAGLDVSPAVRDYLGMASTDVTDWKFVEFSEVPPGPWSVYGDNNTFVLQKREGREARVDNNTGAANQKMR